MGASRATGSCPVPVVDCPVAGPHRRPPILGPGGQSLPLLPQAWGKMQPLHFCNLSCWLPSPPSCPACPAGHLLKAPSSLSLAAMTPSSLLLGACRTLVIFQLLACCLLPLGEAGQAGWAGLREGQGLREQRQQSTAHPEPSPLGSLQSRADLTGGAPVPRRS